MSEAPQRRYGVADHKEIAELDGKQILQAMIDGKLPTPPMAKTLAFDLVEVGEGFAAFEGTPDEAFLNPMGVVHGGWAMTLVDSAAGCAAMTLLPVGAGYTTIETKVNFRVPSSQTQARCAPNLASSRVALEYFQPKLELSMQPAVYSRMEPPP
jgi:uncharacterized protein (TIGR00369 family)